MSDPAVDPAVVPADQRVRVVIADDDLLVRRVLRDVLERTGMTVVAEAGTGREAVELAVYYRPDVLIVDLLMPEGTGLHVIRRLAALGIHEVRTVVLTGTRDEDAAVAVLRSGAVGYLTKDMAITELPRAIHGVMNGEAAVSRRLSLVLIERLREGRTSDVGLRPVRSSLTPREWEVLDLLCEHESTSAIADRLVVSVETVRSHVKSILRKLEVNSRSAAVDLAPSLRKPVASRTEVAEPSPHNGHRLVRLINQ